MFADAFSDRIEAVAYLVGAIGIVLLVWRSRHISAQVKGLTVTVDTTHEQVTKIAREAEQINNAVNHKRPHEPHMVQRLADVEDAVRTIDSKLTESIKLNQAWQYDLVSQLVSKIGIDVRTANAEQTKGEQ